MAVAVWTLARHRQAGLRRCARSFDLIGLVLMAAFLGALEYVLEEGNRRDWFQDETIAWCARDRRR